MFHTLRVVTPARWLADDLTAGGDANQVNVVHDYGLEAPACTRGVAWWCPGTFAARLHATGITPAFTSTDPTVVASLPRDLLGRRMQVVALEDVLHAARHMGASVFLKAADTKIAGLPASAHPIDAVPAFQSACYDRGMAPGSPVIVSETVTFQQEHRIWVHADQPVATSPYLLDGVTWDALTPESRQPSSEALTFARTVTAELAGRAPAGYVLDVGQLADGRWAVVETNPAWSSNPYWATDHHAAEVVAAILAAQRPGQGRQWVPDASVTRRARSLPLRRHESAAAS